MATITRPMERTVNWFQQSVFARAWLDSLPERLAEVLVMPFALLLRASMAFIFLWSGFDKLITDFSAAGFLTNATSGPLGGWFQSLGGNDLALDVINPLVIWGQILIGLSLALGLFTRFGLFWAGAMMMMFYLAQFPPENNLFMDDHLIYIIVFALLGALGVGRILGLDALVERLPWVKRNRVVTLLLG